MLRNASNESLKKTRFLRVARTDTIDSNESLLRPNPARGGFASNPWRICSQTKISTLLLQSQN
jgi:hypothetical protein